MDDVVLVSEPERRGQPARDLRRSFRREPTLSVEQFAERGSLDELHHDESLAAVNPGVEHGDHVRVVEAREDLGFLLESGHRARIPIIAEELDRYRSMQEDVIGAADLGHERPSEHVPEAVAPADDAMRLDDGSSSSCRQGVRTHEGV
jgi:hypothetical protein